MKQTVREDQVQHFSELWHKVFQILQSGAGSGFQGRLEGVSHLEISILDIVSKEHDVILKDINECLQIPASTLTSAISRLEKRGFVNRTITKRDLRSFGLELTDAGRLAQEEHLRQERLSFIHLLEALDNDEEREDFLRMLDKILQHGM